MLTDRYCFLGTPAVSSEILQSLLALGMPPALVITRTDAPVGRKKLLTASAVAEVANAAGIPLFKTNRIGAEAIERLEKDGISLGVVVAYGALLGERALSSLPRGWVNLHFSTLPKYRGAAPIQHAILNRDEFVGVSLFQLDSGMDTGPILETRQYPIRPGDSTETLLRRLSGPGGELIAQWLPRLLAGTAKGSPQLGQPSLAPKLDRNFCYLDPRFDAWRLEALIRAASPEPGAWFSVAGRDVKVFSATPESSGDDGEPGRLELSGGELKLHCAGGTALLLRELQPAGKSRMAAVDFGRGLESGLSIAVPVGGPNDSR